MTRLKGWRAALAAEIERHRGAAFTLGEHDCALFVASCVAAMTGEDPAAAFRGHYKTFRGGLAALRRAGASDVRAFLSERFEPIEPAKASVGDIAIVPSPDPAASDEALGIVTGAMITVVATVGLGVVPLRTALAAWRV